MQVWINGQFHDANAATVGFFDAGFQHGVGLFESLRVRDGTVFRPLAHLERLRASAVALRRDARLKCQSVGMCSQFCSGLPPGHSETRWSNPRCKSQVRLADKCAHAATESRPWRHPT